MPENPPLGFPDRLVSEGYWPTSKAELMSSKVNGGLCLKVKSTEESGRHSRH